MASKKNQTKKIVYLILGVLLLVVLAAGIKVYEDVFAPNIHLPEGKKEYLYVGTKLSLEERAESWRKSNLLQHPATFIRLVTLLGFEHKLKPGRYEVDASYSNFELLKLMASGKQTPVNITFKYAERKMDLVRFWSAQLEADSNVLHQLLSDSICLENTELDTANSIQLFVPNTYNFYWNTDAEELIERMKAEYQQFWDEDRKQKATALALTRQQIGILASIVQKETYQPTEMPTVAGVYYNRLKRRMPLQADPTILYAINDKSIKRVSGKMLDINSPYNTYRVKGLPPGPICVPSVQAIDAVLNMQQHKYLYFCAKEDFSGFHRFAASFAEHARNAQKYQRELNRRKIH
jgi:UPF0755 protein